MNAYRIVIHLRYRPDEHPHGFQRPAAYVGGIDPNTVIIYERIPEYRRLGLNIFCLLFQDNMKDNLETFSNLI